MKRSFASEWTRFLPSSSCISFIYLWCCLDVCYFVQSNPPDSPVWISFCKMKDALCSVWLHVNVVFLYLSLVCARACSAAIYTHSHQLCWRWFEFVTLVWFDWLICYYIAVYWCEFVVCTYKAPHTTRINLFSLLSYSMSLILAVNYFVCISYTCASLR